MQSLPVEIVTIPPLADDIHRHILSFVRGSDNIKNYAFACRPFAARVHNIMLTRLPYLLPEKATELLMGICIRDFRILGGKDNGSIISQLQAYLLNHGDVEQKAITEIVLEAHEIQTIAGYLTRSLEGLPELIDLLLTRKIKRLLRAERTQKNTSDSSLSIKQRVESILDSLKQHNFMLFALYTKMLGVYLSLEKYPSALERPTINLTSQHRSTFQPRNSTSLQELFEINIFAATNFPSLADSPLNTVLSRERLSLGSFLDQLLTEDNPEDVTRAFCFNAQTLQEMNALLDDIETAVEDGTISEPISQKLEDIIRWHSNFYFGVPNNNVLLTEENKNTIIQLLEKYSTGLKAALFHTHNPATTELIKKIRQLQSALEIKKLIESELTIFGDEPAAACQASGYYRALKASLQALDRILEPKCEVMSESLPLSKPKP